MCGRFTLSTPSDVLADLFEIATDAMPDLAPRYNIAPTQPVAAVRRQAGDDVARLDLLRWGLIPSWAKDPSIGSRMINARAETVADKPSFRAAFRRRRCLVPADGFYEWRKVGGRKQPHHFRRADGGPFAFAGLWERWRGDGGATLETCTILTTEANAVVVPVHPRMPVILEPADFDAWLDPDLDHRGVLESLLVPAPDAMLTGYPVGLRVNSPRHDDAGCVEPLHGT